MSAALTLAATPPVVTDAGLELLVPDDDVASPELSIVVPALNEQLTIKEFVRWCKDGLAKAGASGEILIIDSSTDKTAEIAVAAGARVLRAPKRGLGRAYIDSLPFIRGKYIVMGDCDCTYDFRELTPFVERFRSGAEFVMGSRFRGTIDEGAMPPLHRYLGTPVTTWILNVIFSSHFSDIHCGMRGITKEAFLRMGLQSQSWEYASEMVLKSVHMKLKTEEVPIHFLKDVEGRLSHHKRSGWFSPWAAAWINLRAMFTYGANFFLYRPGIVLIVLGLLLTLPVSLGPVAVGPIVLSLHFMLLGLTFVTLGLQSMYMGILTQVFFDYSGSVTRQWLSRFPYTRTTLLSAALFLLGLSLSGFLLVHYVRVGYVLQANDAIAHLGVTGLLLMISGFTTFTFTLLLHAMQGRVAAPAHVKSAGAA
jgi:glycosyltransferase involved in cell wall biosynthesis